MSYEVYKEGEKTLVVTGTLIDTIKWIDRIFNEFDLNKR